jgi:hypothetical protein
MNYFKILLAGIGGAIIAIVILVVVLLGISYWLIEPPPETIVTAIVLLPSQILLAAGIGFVLRFWRSARKQRHRLGGLPS